MSRVAGTPVALLLFYFVRRPVPVIDYSDDDGRWYTLFQRKAELEIKRIFHAFRARGIEPVLIKGWAAARNYPADHPRYFGDIDLAVSADHFDRCPTASELQTISTTGVDLHRELRHLDSVPWPELVARSQTIAVEGTPIRLLCPEDHLRVLCTHWLTDGGEYKDRLWDIYYAIENGPKAFDWQLCLDSVSSTRRNWVTTTIAIAGKYLNLDTSELPFGNEIAEVPDWVVRCLEREWSSELRLRPLHSCINDPKMFMKQIRKRIPPNPIQATIETESSFDEKLRLPRQIQSVAIRLGPSVRRVARQIAGKTWK